MGRRFQFSLRGLLALAAICAAGCWWIIWPRCTAHRFLAALADERTEDAIAMIRQSETKPYHSFPTQLRLDAQLQIVLTAWRQGRPQPQSRAVSDLLRGRQTFTIPRYVITVQRGAVLEEEIRFEE
ncbi:MAG TPA: hypothetical protein VG125_10210 [Pirellulales bacterium]|jgi:hypothetical protein|nr:hypothetical protein [Pirellulales bacterium]